MKRGGLIWVLVWSGWSCLAQTNGPPTPRLCLAVPAPHLRSVAQKIDKLAPSFHDPEAKAPRFESHASRPDTFAASRFSGRRSTFLLENMTAREEADAIQTHRWLVQNGYMRPRRSTSEGRFARGLDAVFEPEVVHFRKVDVSCSLITAIKRRNPLCLLNPIFLNVSW